MGKLVGDVADAFEGAPIPQAFVFVRGWGGVGDRVVELSAKGGFELPLAPGPYDVFVAAQGFAPACKKVAIVSGRSVQLKAKLRVDSEHMEQLTPTPRTLHEFFGIIRSTCSLAS
jgi:hypothetical protein